MCRPHTSRFALARSRPVRWLPVVALPLVALLIAGCSRPDLGFVPVRGQVQLADKALTFGYVSFRPDASQGNGSLHVPSGTIDREGRYELFTINAAGAPPGWYRVLIFADENQEQGAVHPLPPRWTTHAKYTREETTDLKVCVAADAPAGAYDLSLTK